MGRGQKRKKAGARKLAKDLSNTIPYKRMNFLYQAAHNVLASNPDNVNLARFYISTMKTVSKRLVLRIHPNIKRTVCKKCNVLLIPGITSSVRVRAKRQKHRVITCLSCGKVKRFNVNENYKLWIDKPESCFPEDSESNLIDPPTSQECHTLQKCPKEEDDLQPRTSTENEGETSKT